MGAGERIVRRWGTHRDRGGSDPIWKKRNAHRKESLAIARPALGEAGGRRCWYQIRGQIDLIGLASEERLKAVGAIESPDKHEVKSEGEVEGRK